MLNAGIRHAGDRWPPAAWLVIYHRLRPAMRRVRAERYVFV
jgi:hypothetical protein